MDQFKIQDGERILREGKLVYLKGWKGEGTPLSEMEVLYTGGILTDRRLVVWEKPQLGGAFTPLAWLLVRFWKGRPMIHALPLDRVAAIHIGPGPAFTVEASDGTLVRIGSNAFSDDTPQWLQAVGDAVQAAAPARKVSRTEKLLRFA